VLIAKRMVHGRIRAMEEGLLEQIGFELVTEDCYGDREKRRSRRNYQL
jgi:hypothetical protein